MSDSWQEKVRLREIEKVLAAELNAAQMAFHAATVHLAELTAGVPSSIPVPCAICRLTLAGDARRLAFRKLKAALERWKNFSSHGTVPPDLEDWDGIQPRPAS